jgi:hypothetical protein
VTDFQTIAFRWITQQDAPLALLVFGLGMLYAFQGFRMFRALLVLSAGICGWCAGAHTCTLFSFDPRLGGLLGTATFVAACLKSQKLGVAVLSAAFWGLLAGYLAHQMHMPVAAAYGSVLVCGGLGMLFAHLNYMPMTVVLTTVQGAILMMIGAVGMTDKYMPTVAETFRSWSYSQSLLVPILLVMVGVMAFSIQSNARKGDMRSGV